MAKQQTRGLGADPLDAITGGGGEASPPPKPTPKKASGKKAPEPKTASGSDEGKPYRTTVMLPHELAERAKGAAYWTPGLSLSAIIAEGVRREVERLEKANGGPFDSAEGPLKRGRQ